MSKMGQHVARMIDAHTPTLDEVLRAEEQRKLDAPWEYSMTDEELDALDEKRGPLEWFDAYKEDGCA